MMLTWSPPRTWRTIVPPHPITSSSGWGAMIITAPPAGDHPSFAGRAGATHPRTLRRSRRIQVLAIRLPRASAAESPDVSRVPGVTVVTDNYDSSIPRPHDHVQDHSLRRSFAFA